MNTPQVMFNFISRPSKRNLLFYHKEHTHTHTCQPYIKKLRHENVTKKTHLGKWPSFPVFIVCSCDATTDRTSKSMRLNSSKQHQEPLWAQPPKNLPSILKSKPSEQLNTMQCFPNALAKSFTVSVFPVPAGPTRETMKLQEDKQQGLSPAGLPPKFKCSAPVSVR